MDTKLLLLIFFIFMCIRCITFPVKKMSKFEWIVYTIVLIIIVAFRPESMPDYINYIRSFYGHNERLEPIFQILYYTIQSITQDYKIFFYIIAILTISIKIFAIKKMSVFPALSILTWMSYMLFLQDMIAIRAALAAGLGLVSIYYKCNNQNNIMYISLIFAVLCHYSAVVLWIIPFISLKKWNREYYLILLGVSAFLALINFTISNFGLNTGIESLDITLDMYEDAESTNPFKPQQLMRVFICVITWINLNHCQTNKYFLTFVKTYTFGCIVFFLFSGIAGFAIRLSEILCVSEIFIIPSLSLIFGKNNLRIGKFIPIIYSTYIFAFEYMLPAMWNAETL